MTFDLQHDLECMYVYDLSLSTFLYYQRDQWERRARREVPGDVVSNLIVQYGDNVTYKDNTLTISRNGAVYRR